MEAKYITLGDLKKNGFVLSKAEAQEFAPLIREASHNGGDEEIIYPGDDEKEDDAVESEYLTDEEEKQLMDVLGITTESTPNEYYTALVNYIGPVTEQSNPKLLHKVQALGPFLTTGQARDQKESETDGSGTENSIGTAKNEENVGDQTDTEGGAETEATTEESADANPEDVAENATTEDGIQVEGTTEVKEHWKAKAKRLREAGLEERAATQEDIEANPESGLKVGDIGEFPIKQA
jgi:hypothetical protein